MSEWLRDTPLIIGHRGASADAPENTLAAFALAVDQGADGVEFDVQMSADGVPVVIHDANLDRTTNGSGRVSSLPLAELKQLDAGNGESIPTLEEVLHIFGSKLLFNVEIKGVGQQNQGLERAVAKQIAAHNLAHRTVVSSFSFRSVYRFRKLAPPGTMVGFLHSTPISGRRLARWLIRNEADHPPFRRVTESYMRWAQHHGLRVHTWTVDDLDKARELIGLGTHGLITNRPGYLREQLQ
jgi:glycerophosphoryl diester phosphodiesterase